MKRFLAVLILGAALLAPAAADAATGRAGDLVVVNTNQVVKDDLYAAGETVTVAGTVRGDVVAAGSEVTISGRVTGNVWAVGATVRVSGRVDGSIRSAGSDVNVSGTVGRDVITFGKNLDLGKRSRVDGDVIAYGEDVRLAGVVGRDARVGGENLTVSGNVEGDVSARGGNLLLTDGARISGNVRYTAEQKLQRSDSAQVGGSIDFTQEKERHDSFADRLNRQVFWFLASILLLLGILLYARRAARRGAALIGERPGMTLVAGAAFVLVTPFLIGVFLISIVGLPLSLITLLGYALVLYTAKIFLALAVGGLITRGLPDRFWPVFGAGAFGLAVYYFLAAIPVVGGLATVAALLLGTGAQLLLFKEVYDANRKKYGV